MLFRILPLLLFLLLVPIWIIVRGKSGRVRLLLAFPNLLLAMATLWLGLNEGYSQEEASLKNTVLFATLVLTIPETIYAAGLLISHCWKQSPRIRRAIAAAGAVLALGSMSLLIYGGTIGYKDLAINRISYSSERIPARFRGYRIAVLSDLHIGTFASHPSYIRRVTDSLLSLRPDIIAVVGDFVNYNQEEIDAFLPTLRTWQAPDGVFAVMGNHDYLGLYKKQPPAQARKEIALLQQKIRSLSWRLLLNEHENVVRDGDTLSIVGIENAGKGRFPNLGNLPKATHGIPRSAFPLLLSHDPAHWRDEVLAKTDIPLTLSGHTHGGQIRLGWLDPASWFMPEVRGSYREGDRELFVTTGIGEAFFPVRLGVRPEIVLLTLQNETLTH